MNGWKEDIVAFLDHAAPWYPGGLSLDVPPQSTARPAQPSAVEAPKRAEGPKLIFVGFADSGSQSLDDPWQGSEGELLRNALTRGMRMDPSSASLIRVSGGAEASKIVDQGSAPLVVLGARAWEALCPDAPRTRGEWARKGGAQIMATHAITDVISNPSMKREFWDDLRKVMTMIGQE